MAVARGGAKRSGRSRQRSTPPSLGRTPACDGLLGTDAALDPAAGAALDLLPTIGATIGVLGSDVLVSGTHGRGPAVEVARGHPGICVLPASGCSGEVTELPPRVGRAAGFLPQPLQPCELTRRVRTLLDG